MKIGAGFSTGRLAYNHNTNQEYRKTLKNVNPERTIYNIVFIDHLKGKSIEDFINEGMQKYIDQYNEGKKPCKKIKTNYTEWHKSQKRYQQGGKIEFAWEAVLSYGSMEDIGTLYESQETREKIYLESQKLFKNWLQEWQKEYPHLKIMCAVGHYDEKTPHMHVIYTPIADGYQRGLKHQICMSRALEQDGIEKITDTKQALEAGGFQQSRFYKKFRHDIMNPSLKKIGYEIKEEQHGIEHIDSKIYTEVAKKIEDAKKFTEELQKAEDIEILPSYNPKDIKKIAYKESILSKTETLIATTPSNFETMRADADAKAIAKKTKDKIKAQQKALEDFQKSINPTDREQKLIKENAELKQRLEQSEKIISSLKQKLEIIRNRIVDFLNQYKMIDRFIAFFKRQDEIEKKHQNTQIFTKSAQNQEYERTR